MKKLVFEVMKSSKDKNKSKVKIPKCWLCMDDGFVYYDKKENGMKYEVAARCRCIKGQNRGMKIGQVPDVLAEDIAKINLENFKEKHPNIIKNAI